MTLSDLRTLPRGAALLHDPLLNKGTAFTDEERDALGLRGLLPPRVHTLDEQVARVLGNIRRESTPLEKYLVLTSLQDRNETLFYRVLVDYTKEMTPLVYTPTVGEACIQFGHIFRRPRGIFISSEDRGRMARILRNWHTDEVRCIVVTDGERILGLGDLGADGMGIPIGKLSLYTACAGIHPSVCLPVTLDVGTENEELLADPLYLGLRQRRIRGEAYDALVDEFVSAVQEVFPRALIQFEDFAGINAFRLLRKYQTEVCTFNDDIQGTAAVALAGLLSALRLTGGSLESERILFLGAGEAGTGIADLVVASLVQSGLSVHDARRRCWFVDSKGLVVAQRTDLAHHKRPYAHQAEYLPDLLSAVNWLRPSVLVGVSGQPAAFTEEIVRAMAQLNRQPIIFALSNPTSKAECTAEEAYAWSEGRAVFASGSPFDPVEIEGRRLTPGQGNNVYIFPGVALAVTACGVRRVTDEMFLTAARTLAELVMGCDLEAGCVYPGLDRIREVSLSIACAVAEVGYANGLSVDPRPDDLRAHIRGQMFEPVYRNYV